MRNFYSILLTVVCGMGALIIMSSFSQVKGETEKTVEQSLKEIQQSQGVGQDQQVDCTKITDKQFEELGDAYMRVMHPNPRQHAFMDRMMGGEGSQLLAYMHRMMGARYLGCWDGYGYGMMSYGTGEMMGYGPGYGMMGNSRGHGWMGMMQHLGMGKNIESSKFLTKDDAEATVEAYVTALHNPNLKVGKTKDNGNSYEIEIITKEGSLVDNVEIDKSIGEMRFVYGL